MTGSVDAGLNRALSEFPDDGCEALSQEGL
jgi:hypothetical protein